MSTKTNKVQYNDSFGLDLDAVVCWRLVPTYEEKTLLNKEKWNLEIYISGNMIIIQKDILGEENFNNLVKCLIKKFTQTGSSIASFKDGS
jgi:hypothetical protein